MLISRYVIGLAGIGLLTAVAQTSQLTPDDTVAETRANLPKIEPVRQARRLDGVQRFVALRYPTAADGIDHFNTSLPELVRFLGSEVAIADTRFVAEEGSLGSFAFDDPLLLMITGNRAVMRVSDSQKRMLGDYPKKGGMLFAEDVRAPLRGASSDVGHSGTPFDRMLKSLLADPLVLDNAGKM